MKKQLYGSPLSGSPEKKKKKYMEPVLSEVAFTAEKGFATSKSEAKSSNIILDDYYGETGSWF